MSKSSRYWVRFQALSFAIVFAMGTSVIATASPVNGHHGSNNNESARLATFDSTTGETSFALSLNPPLAREASQPGQVVIYFDTSASQTAKFREDALKSLKSVLTGLDPKDQVQLYAVDIDPVPLTTGFVGAESAEMNVALERLDERLPLGSTDMIAMLENGCKQLTADHSNKNLIYIGDGISRGALIASDRFESMVKDLVAKKVSVSSFAIGPERDVELLAALANHTGGNVFIDTDDIGSSDQAAAGLVTTVRGSVFWPTEIKKPAQVVEIFPAVVPPLRSDRDTILIGSLTERGQFNISISGVVNGEQKEFSWPVKAEISNKEFSFLPKLLDVARENRGASLATVGSAGLREMARVIMASSHQITRLGATVLNASSSTVQEEVVQDEVLEEAAPQEQATDGLMLEGPQDNVLPTQDGGLNLVDDQDLSDEQFLRESQGASEFLDIQANQQDVSEQRLRGYVSRELSVSNDLLNSKPDQGIDRLKAMLDTVTRAPGISTATRNELAVSLRSALRSANYRKQEFDNRVASAAQSASVAQERRNLVDSFEADQEKLASYFAQFNSLLDERNYDGATAVIFAAADTDRTNPDLLVAEENSIMRTNWEKYWRLRNLKIRGFLDTMNEVEASAVPFSGNPAIKFPNADEWLEKKRLRKKWQDVRVAGNDKEEAILAALNKDVRIDYFEQRFGDIVTEWRSDYGINIEIDESARDNQLDEETVITKKLDNISLRSAMRVILNDFDCTYVIKDEILYIMSSDAALDNLVINIYNVGDLVAPKNAAGGFGGGQGQGQGGGGGGGGRGGGGGGLGGGNFRVEDTLTLGSKKKDEKPVALSVEPAENQSMPQAWNQYFEKFHAKPADVRETIRQMMKQKKADQVVAVISGCIRNNQSQDWMLEGLVLAMQINGASLREVERTVMTAVDYSDDPDDLMTAAVFMTKNGMEQRAIKLLKYIAETNPARHEPFALAMRAAQKINDKAGIKWATLGILSQEWPEHPSEMKKAFLAAETIKVELARNGKTQELQQFESQVAEALQRDCIIKVTWAGDADMDLVVEEPGGTVCSRDNTRTMCGGVMMGDMASKRDESGQVSEYYVLPKGFKGDYRLAVRRVWGEVAAGKVTVEVYQNYRSAKEVSVKRQVKLDDVGAIVIFKLNEGRRTEKLNQAAIQTAAAVEFMADRGLLASRLASYQGSSAVSRHVSANSDDEREIRSGNRRNRDPGFRPEITTLSVGQGATVTATTADRLYVLISTPTQNFSDITEVTTFSFVGDGGGGAGTGAGAGAGL